MSNKNTTLQASKNLKDDEFYTTYECIENELCHYKEQLRNKIILCNCDDPYESNFCLFFLRNFFSLGLRRLICTSYYSSRIVSERFEKSKKGDAYVLDVDRSIIKKELSDNEITEILCKKDVIAPLKGNGDFRSAECLNYLDQADIVVTNPPFSLFRTFLSEILNRNKSFLIIGNQNALTYKEIFPYIKEGKIWTGYHFGEMKFKVPLKSEPRNSRYWVDKDGQKWRSMGNAMWLTNLDTERRHELLPISKKYNSKEYLKYDNHDAIHVKTIKDIPYDFEGVMGVPITIINRCNPEQFEIVGEANHGIDNEFDLFAPRIKGKLIFKRILIKNKKPGIKVS